jgi:prepilin-type N-terminal cleavage/methylation domain-containing protein
MRNKVTRGLSMIEVMIAVAILAVTITGVLMALFANSELMQVDREYVVAANFAKQKLSEIKACPYFNGNLPPPVGSNFPAPQGTSDAAGNTIFARFNRVTSDDPIGRSPGAYFLPYGWAAAKEFAPGDFVVPAGDNGTGFWYECTAVSTATATGLTGGAQPTFPKVEGATVTDNQVTWTCRRNVLTPPAGQSYCGTVIFPADLAGGVDSLREDMLNPSFHFDVDGNGGNGVTNLDLDGTGTIETTNRLYYRSLPVIIQIRWTSYGGEVKKYEIETILCQDY